VDETSEAIAPGSLFQLFGVGLGPDVPVRAQSLPLPTVLAGVSIRINAGSATIDAPILSTEAQRIEALLPANAPLGDAQLVVIRDGVEGPPLAVQVVRRSFAFYASAQNLSLSDGVWIPNTSSHPARPGGLVSLWGTGLGAGSGAEKFATAEPIPGLEVHVGGKPTRLVYAGSQSGVDLIVVEVPLNAATGCNVGAKLRYPEGPSADDLKTNSLNFVSLAISPDGESCASPFDPPPQIIDRIRAQQGLKWGWLNVSPSEVSLRVGSGTPLLLPALGTCGVSEASIGIPGLNAGSTVNLHAPHGVTAFSYSPNPGFVYYAPPAQLPPVEPGEYTLENGKGGTDIGPFSTSFTLDSALLDSPVTWMNRDTLEVQRENDVHITWNGGDPKGGYVVVGLLFVDGPPGSGWLTFLGGTSCVARAEQGALTISSDELWTSRTRSAGSVFVSVSYYSPRWFAAAGIDAGLVLFSTGDSKALEVH